MNKTRFKLDAAIAAWRRLLMTERSISPEDVDELESHLRDEIDALHAKGLDAKTAFHQAARGLGDYAALERAYRRVYWKKVRSEHRVADELKWRGTMFKSYLKIAVRNLRKYKGYSFINVFGLALGMACCLLILLFVQYERSFDRFHTKADQIYRLVEIQTFSGRSPEHVGLTMGVMGQAMVDDYSEVTGYVRFYPAGEPLARYEDKQLNLGQTFYADTTVFELFDFELIAGDPATALKEPFTIVLTEEATRRFFEEAPAVGRVLQVDGADFRVTGVLKDVPANSHLQFDALLSFSTTQDNPDFDYLYRWGSNALITYLFLKEGADPEALEAKFPEYVQKYLPDRADNYELYLQPLRDIHLHSTEVNYDWNSFKGSATTVYSFSVIAALILLIACINFMNLATARSANRAKEVGLRKVVGAHRLQLVNQFMGESVLLALIALVIALGFVAVSIPLLNELVGRELDLDVFDHLLIVAGVLGLTLFVGLVAGSYPALYLSAFRPATVLKGGLTLGRRGPTLRKALVVAQFTISVVLIISTGLAAQQFQFMRYRDMGFNKERVVTLWVPDTIREQYETFKAELLQNPAIDAVTASQSRLGSFLNETGIRFEGRDPEEHWNVPWNGVDYDFIPFYGLELVAGRNFSRDVASDTSGEGGYVINEALMHKLGWTSAVGKPFALGGGDELGTVVGVVKDFHYYSLHHEIEPLVLFARPGRLNSLSVRISPDNIPETLAFLEDQWKKWAPDRPFDYAFLDDRFARLYQSEARLGEVFGAFSVLAIVIACLGLFGLVAFTAEQRTKEIGVRKVLGASIVHIVVLLTKDFTRLVGIAILLAVPIAYVAMRRWLDGFAYRIEISWGLLLAAGLLAVLIAWLTVSYQSIKAALIDPVEALRYE